VPGRFDGKTALITGASRGIGLGIARRLVAEGARVCVTARTEETLADAVAQLGGPRHAIGVPVHSDDPQHRADAVARTVDAFGSLDFLVNNAGINPVYGPLVEADLGAARKVFEVNVIAALGWVQQACRGGLGPGGAIVNVSSVAGLRPAPKLGLYGASKAVLVHLTGQLAVELGPGIRVNAIAPAIVRTKFAAALYEGREEKVASAYPLKRLGMPDDVSGAVAFLLSDDAAWLTGHTVVIDGGVTLKGGI
jgi:3-oxoacyl-[acyl-carrier protein] reductase